MKALMLGGFTACFAFLLRLWLRQWREGFISRSPAFADVCRETEPRRFKVWTAVHGITLFFLTGLLILAWWALLTGNLN